MSSSTISLTHLRATVDSARTRRSPAPAAAARPSYPRNLRSKVHFVDLSCSTSDSESDSDNDSDDLSSFLSANSSQTSLSSSPVETCKPLPFAAAVKSTSSQPARPRIDVSFLSRRQGQTKVSVSPSPCTPSSASKTTPTRYLYQGGITTVVTGGVMLGSPVSPAVARSPKSLAVKKTGSDSSNWRRA